MKSAIDWLNSNEGALMVIVTFIYVIATIAICYFNSKSAKAAQDQITASITQQKQNAGIQLYNLRKQALQMVADEKYNEVFWDVSALFPDDIDKAFQKVVFKKQRATVIQAKMFQFETHITLDRPKDADEYRRLAARSEAIDATEEEKAAFLSFCDTHRYTFYDKVNNEMVTLDYRQLSIDFTSLNCELKALRTQLLLKMRNFIKSSISSDQE